MLFTAESLREQRTALGVPGVLAVIIKGLDLEIVATACAMHADRSLVPDSSIMMAGEENRF